MKTFRLCLFVMLVFQFGLIAATKVRVQIVNNLRDGRSMAVHCRSEDDDLGSSVVKNGGEIDWKFSVNFWGTTLFYCNVEWDGLSWHHFNAYSAERDHARCHSECRWVIAEQGSLLGYDQESKLWEQFPM